MPPIADPPTAALIKAYDALMRRLRAEIVNAAARSWLGMNDYHDANINRWIRTMAPLLDSAQQRTAALTDSYLATLETVVTKTPARPVGVAADLVSTETLRGVPANEVLRRPAIELYTQLSKGKPYTEAVQAGLRRATSITETNLQLAKTHSARHVLSLKPKVVGSRRSLRGSSCALCIVASTQRYRKSQLQPIHPGCNCGVIPIFGTKDPGQVIDPTRLDDIEERMAQRFGAYNSGAREVPGVKLEGSDDPLLYRDVLVTHEHGELGPILGVRGQDFTGPNDL